MNSFADREIKKRGQGGTRRAVQEQGRDGDLTRGQSRVAVELYRLQEVED